MEKKFTFYARLAACTVFTLITLVINSFTAKTFAQITCQSESGIYLETFGTGTSASSNPDILPTGLTYQATGPLANEGTYRIIHDAQQKIEWHASEDGTANNIHGKMLVVNGQAETFYSHRMNDPNGFSGLPSIYIASLNIMNVNTPGTCAPDPLLPMITFRVEYLSLGGTWEPFVGSPYTAPLIPQTMDPQWVSIGSSFTLPPTGEFLVKSVRLVLADGTAGGCGNDFAIDDIKFSLCPGGSPTPVNFLNITAQQKGSGVNVEWSTSQELNSKSFAVEKSANGNSGWSVVALVSASGNSSTVKKYSAYDPQPGKGVNFYRIKQADIDNRLNYSKTVKLKLVLKTGVSVIANPFRNLLTIDFSSLTDQIVSARLVDITGKQVATEKWIIKTGSTRKDFSNLNGLQQGMYILTVSSAKGEILYNNKVVKQ